MPPRQPNDQPPSRLTAGAALKITAVVTAYLIALILLWVARDIFLTAFIGVLFGLAVSSGATLLARWRIPRGLGAALVVFGFLGALYGIGAWIAPTLRSQGALLRTRIPEAVDRLDAWVSANPALAGIVLGGSQTTQPRNAADSVGSGLKPAAAAPHDTGTAGIPSLRQRVGSELGGVTRYLFPFLSSTVTVFAGFFLILVLSIYIGADPLLYHSGILHLVPPRARTHATLMLSRVATVLRRWLISQLIAMLVIGIAATVALLILRVKAALALGVIAGLLEFVPTIGPILAALPAIAMGFLDSPQKALSVTLAYLVIEQAEGHILIPMLMKEGMDLPPALTIIMQGVMALLFGFLGLLVAVPLLAAIIATIKLLYVEDIIDREAAIEVVAATGSG